MPQNMDKTRRVITVDDERGGLPNSVFLAPGTYTINADGSISIGGVVPGGFALTGIVTPAQLPDATTQNWNPGTLTDISRIRADTAGSNGAVGGMTGGTDGKVVVITNVGANDLTLLSQAAGSTAANRFALNGDKLIPAGTSFMVMYDGALSRWSGIGS